jgi:fermentation-respiration switch protein FrsA (DUF1100 family)
MATDDDVSDTTKQVIKELDPGTVIEDMVLLSRRQVIGLATGTLSVGALAAWGAGDASAQSVGSIGTSSERVDVFAQSLDVAGTLDVAQLGASGNTVDVYASGNGNVQLDGDVTSTSVSGGFELTIDGDTYQFNE